MKDKQQNNIGAVLCDCSGSLSTAINFDKLIDGLAKLHPDMVLERCSALCSETLNGVCKTADKLVVAACDRETLETSLQNAVSDGLLQTVNIREHCGWVHTDKKIATRKALEMISAAVRRVEVSEAVGKGSVEINQDVLVVGSGPSGMQAADCLAKLGRKVTLITRDDKLGGQTSKMPLSFAYTAETSEAAAKSLKRTLEKLQEKITGNKQIDVHFNTELKSVAGQFGNFTITVNSQGKEQTYSAGAVVLATGQKGSAGLEKLTAVIENGNSVDRIAIIADITSQQTTAVWSQILSTAEALVKSSRCEVKIFCDSVRVAAAGMESLYKRLRQAGVMIIKSEVSPSVSNENSKSTVTYHDAIAGIDISEQFDLVVKADAEVDDTVCCQVNGLRPGPDGACQYDDVWLLPAQTNKKGIFVIGSARGNSELRQALADGLAAGHKIEELLADKKIELPDDAAEIDPDKCVACLTCLRLCPHGAISFDTEAEAAYVWPQSCQRCGVCTTHCPAVAIQLKRYTDEQLAAEIGDSPRTTIFVCENSAYQAATMAGIGRLQYDEKIRLIRVPCAGKVDARDILGALEKGAEKAAVIGCHPDSCQYLTGSTRAKKNVERIQQILTDAGIDGSKVFFGSIAAMESNKFIEYVKE